MYTQNPFAQIAPLPFRLVLGFDLGLVLELGAGGNFPRGQLS